jgi:hypothetical protein
MASAMVAKARASPFERPATAGDARRCVIDDEGLRFCSPTSQSLEAAVGADARFGRTAKSSGQSGSACPLRKAFLRVGLRGTLSLSALCCVASQPSGISSNAEVNPELIGYQLDIGFGRCCET